DTLGYHVGDFFSGAGAVGPGMVTLHPVGLPHGPRPRAMENGLDGRVGAIHNEVAVMADFANPTRVSEFALGLSRPDYMDMWSGYTTEPRFTWRADRLDEVRRTAERLAHARDTLRPPAPDRGAGDLAGAVSSAASRAAMASGPPSARGEQSIPGFASVTSCGLASVVIVVKNASVPSSLRTRIVSRGGAPPRSSGIRQRDGTPGYASSSSRSRAAAALVAASRWIDWISPPANSSQFTMKRRSPSGGNVECSAFAAWARLSVVAPRSGPKILSAAALRMTTFHSASITRAGYGSCWRRMN